MLSALLLAIALAMDALAVAVTRGAVDRRARDGVVLALLCGGFQAGMAALGWLAGDAAGDLIARWDHWIAFGLLAVLGARMIVAGVRAGRGDAPDAAPPARITLYLALALATSLDAAAAGLTLPLIDAPIAIVLALIGAITAALAGAGYAIGERLGARFGPRLEIAGGVVLIGVGAKILIEHLTG